MKVILTADDYGATDSIDNAVLRALEGRKINSVAIFPNAGDRKRRIRRLVETVKQIDGAPFSIELGVHLTFCTGRPLSSSPTKNFMDGSYFKKFTKTQRSGNRDKEEVFVKAEIRKQIDEVQALLGEDKNVEHITCHHNTLFWFEDYFKWLLEVMAEDKYRHMALRSPFFIPEGRFRVYQEFAMPLKNRFFFLRGNDTKKCYKEWRKKYQKGATDYLKQFEVSTPKATFNGHYGPLPGSNMWDEEINREVLDRKHPKLNAFFNGDHDSGTYEVMLHLVEPEYRFLEKINKEFKAHKRGRANAYPGLNPKYIKGRMAETRSIMSYTYPDHVKLSTWN